MLNLKDIRRYRRMHCPTCAFNAYMRDRAREAGDLTRVIKLKPAVKTPPSVTTAVL